MWEKGDREIKELLEQYIDIEIRDSEIQEKRKENQAEPSKEFRKTMEQLITDVPKYVKKQWWQKQKDFFAFACTMCAKVAIFAVLFVVFASELLGKGILTASINQIVLNPRKEDEDGLTFSINHPKKSSELKPVSELAVEFSYLPAEYGFISDELSSNSEVRAFSYAKDTEKEFSVYITRVETVGNTIFVGAEKYSVFLEDATEITKIETEIGESIYMWMQFDYLFIIKATEDLQEELGQLIASIQIS